MLQIQVIVILMERLVTSYDLVKCRFVTRIGGAYQTRDSDFADILLSTENMEPYRRVYKQTHVPRPSTETCTIRLGDHYLGPNSVLPCVTFHADVFGKIGGITASLHTGGQAQHNILVELIETKELMKHTKAEKIQSQQAEFERGFVKAICYLLSCGTPT